MASGALFVGDAAIFVRTIRLVEVWFPPGRVPMPTQPSGVLGHPVLEALRFR